jgi:hypothetical protein
MNKEEDFGYVLEVVGGGVRRLREGAATGMRSPAARLVVLLLKNWGLSCLVFFVGTVYGLPKSVPCRSQKLKTVIQKAWIIEDTL